MAFSQKLIVKLQINGLMDKKLVMKNMKFLKHFSCSFCKFRKLEIKIKALNIFMREKEFLYC